MHVYRISYSSRGDSIQEHFPTKKEAIDQFNKIKADSSEIDFEVRLQKLKLGKLTKHKLCQIMDDWGFVEEFIELKTWQKPEEPQEDD